MATDCSKIGGSGRMVNPLVLEFQKMGLELKCPLCLSLFNRPTLFPCDHIFCSSCVPRSTEKESECLICNTPYTEKDLRPASHVENMVAIYRSLDVSFNKMFQPSSSGAGRVLEKCSVSVKSDIREDDSRNGQSIVSLTANKRVHVCSSLSVEDVSGMKLKIGTSNVTMNVKENLALPPAGSDLRAVGLGDSRAAAATMGLNQVVAHSPVGSDDSSSYRGSEHNQENHLGKRPAELNFGEKASPGTEDHERDLKRQKHSDVSAGVQEPIVSEPIVACNSICGFCQSSNFSEDTGEMLHYIHGNPVVGHKVNSPNAIHVHAKCIEWAPQVYYVGETVKNVNKELARGAKLKCVKCGLKGAALGCYAKSCKRTYHVPCALKDDCRWETENFLMLCPTHAKQKFPYEKKGKSKNRALEDQPLATPLISSQPSNSCEGLPDETKKLVLCGSALSSAEKLILEEFARTFGVTVSKFWRPDVTHVIASTNANGACTRTLKVLSAILTGKWVLNIDWIKSCLEAKLPLGEEPYEVSHDNHDCRDGPKTGRLRALSNEPNLFDGLKFYFSGDFVSRYKRDLQNLVSRGGGAVLITKEDLVSCARDDQGAPSSILIVYNIDPPPGIKLGEEVEIMWDRLNEAEDLAAKIGSRVVTHMWILESIASCKLQPKVT